MRYLHILDAFRDGSAETTFLHMLRAFRDAAPDAAAPGEAPCAAARETHDVLALATGVLHREFARAADRVIVSAQAPELAALLAQPYDVIHLLCERSAHRAVPLALAVSEAALVYSKKYDASARHRMHGTFDHAADEAVLSACDAVTFATPELADGYHLPPGRATVLRKAAPLTAALAVPPLSPCARPSTGPASTSIDANFARPPRVLCAADFLPHKRLGDLAPILARVRERVPDAELRLIGHGTPAQLSALQDRIADANLAGALHIAAVPTSADSLATELADARLFLLPSGVEGVSSVVLQAMAAARPVVTSRVGHIGHVLTHGREGFLAEPGDVDAFAAHVTALLEDAPLAARLGAAGRARAAAHDVRAVAPELLAVLRRAARVRRKAA